MNMMVSMYDKKGEDVKSMLNKTGKNTVLIYFAK